MGYEPDNAVSSPDYYLNQPTRCQPEFWGKGAKLLGIEGEWDEATFRRLFVGHRPDQDIKLPGIRMVKNRRGAFDHTFNRDKASSVLELVAGDERIPRVARRAEVKAMSLLEKSARARVRKASQIAESKARHPKGWKYPERVTGNIVAARFQHFDSRLNDPHGHNHWVVLNLTYDRTEKEWKAVELGYADRKAISHAYHKEYAKGLRELGYDATWDGKRLEVHGVAEDVLQDFSQRAEGIAKTKARYEDKGLSKQGRQKVQLFDRPETKLNAGLDQLRQVWVDRLGPARLSALRDVVSRARRAASRSLLSRSINRHIDMVRRFQQTRETTHERVRSR